MKLLFLGMYMYKIMFNYICFLFQIETEDNRFTAAGLPENIRELNTVW